MLVRMSDPLGAVLSLQRALADTYRSNWLGASTASPGAFPPVNVFRRGDNLVVVAELAGVDRASLDVQIKERQLRITGKKHPRSDEKVSVHRRERALGEFDRTLSIPLEIDADGVKAEYRDGTLAIFLPRAEKDKPRSIAID